MHLAPSALAFLCQCLHLHQVGSIGSQVIQGHGEAFRAAHIVAVGIPLWMVVVRGSDSEGKVGQGLSYEPRPQPERWFPVLSN